MQWEGKQGKKTSRGHHHHQQSSSSESFSDSREEAAKHLLAEDVETKEKRWEEEREIKRRMEEKEEEMRMLKKKLTEKETEKILLEHRIREMERRLKREKDAEVDEARRWMAKERREEWMAWEEEKTRLETAWEQERTSLVEAWAKEKAKLEEANGALGRRADHYQGASIELQERKEELEGDMRRLEGRNEALLENYKELEYFRKRCGAILRGERVDTGTVREFIQDAAGEDELQLHVAVSLGLDRHVEGLLRRLNGTERNDRRWSALQLAVARGDNKTVRKSWDQRSAREEYPPLLHLAAANRQRDTAKMLKKKKMKLEAEYEGVTAWDVAEAMKHWEMTDILNKRNGLMCWKDLGPSPRGLPNLGQTCYMNCVLQSLYHLQPLAEVFRYGDSSVECSEKWNVVRIDVM
ncbi:centrosomal protein of 164 kDa-like [Eriocheir sinensis]|uniref:centrosomal protein of 164 kDa-like n=1 Tax=Eriocheir sinensis TaxID=95602 RepID=UPI0021C56EA7|nr:centrosomal protein of 164 kDa-like [Eriocheir sinensis]